LPPSHDDGKRCACNRAFASGNGAATLAEVRVWAWVAGLADIWWLSGRKIQARAVRLGGGGGRRLRYRKAEWGAAARPSRADGTTEILRDRSSIMP